MKKQVKPDLIYRLHQTMNVLTLPTSSHVYRKIKRLFTSGNFIINFFRLAFRDQIANQAFKYVKVLNNNSKVSEK